jgi:hypothetical protein
VLRRGCRRGTDGSDIGRKRCVQPASKLSTHLEMGNEFRIDENLRSRTGIARDARPSRAAHEASEAANFDATASGHVLGDRGQKQVHSEADVVLPSAPWREPKFV